ncbi:hypothetical protein AAHA92_09085 [Salvia divinorum]|uniref:Uncharacterized protein n=1 Tax=Salvia divinorum TaxID=28513 RepID=A0ABD1HQA6_SALDI
MSLSQVLQDGISTRKLTAQSNFWKRGSVILMGMASLMPYLLLLIFIPLLPVSFPSSMQLLLMGKGKLHQASRSSGYADLKKLFWKFYWGP